MQAGSAASKAGDKVAEKAKEARKKLGFMQVNLCCDAVELCHMLHMYNGVTSAVLLSSFAMHCMRTMVSQLTCTQVSASSKALWAPGSAAHTQPGWDLVHVQY